MDVNTTPTDLIAIGGYSIASFNNLNRLPIVGVLDISKDPCNWSWGWLMQLDNGESSAWTSSLIISRDRSKVYAVIESEIYT